MTKIFSTRRKPCHLGEPARDGGWRRPRGHTPKLTYRRPCYLIAPTVSHAIEPSIFNALDHGNHLEYCLHLLSTVDESLLDGRDALLLLDLFLDLRDLRPSVSLVVVVIRLKRCEPCTRSRCRARSPCRSACAPWRLKRQLMCGNGASRHARAKSKRGHSLDQHFEKFRLLGVYSESLLYSREGCIVAFLSCCCILRCCSAC